MMNLMVGFEQNNQFTPTRSTPIASPQFITRLHIHKSHVCMYTIYGASGTVVGYIVEDSAGRPHALLLFHVARDAPLQVLAPCCHAMFFTRIGRSLHALWTLRCVRGGVC